MKAKDPAADGDPVIWLPTIRSPAGRTDPAASPQVSVPVPPMACSGSTYGTSTCAAGSAGSFCTRSATDPFAGFPCGVITGATLVASVLASARVEKLRRVTWMVSPGASGKVASGLCAPIEAASAGSTIPAFTTSWLSGCSTRSQPLAKGFA